MVSRMGKAVWEVVGGALLLTSGLLVGGAVGAVTNPAGLIVFAVGIADLVRDLRSS